MIDVDQNLEGRDYCLLNVYFDSNQHELYLKLYDITNNKLYSVKDRSLFKGYFLVKKNDIDQKVLQQFLNEHNEFEVTLETKYDGIQNKPIEVYKFESYNVFNVYKKWTEELQIPNQYEYLIKYYESYYLSKELIPCGIYECKNGTLVLKKYPLNETAIHTLTKMIQNNNTTNKIYNQYLTEYTELLSQPVPFIKRVAVDIETYNKEDKFPDISNPTDPIVCCSFYDNDGFQKVVVSQEHLDPLKLEEKVVNIKFHDYIEFVKTEVELIYKIFEIINQYPVVLTYNGDQFDLAYIYQRSKNYDIIDQEKNPIKFSGDNLTKKYGQRKDPAYLLNSVHLDLFRLFINRSLHTYGFNTKYTQFGLDNVATALLGEGKIKHEKSINDLSVNDLAEYCLKDSELTLRLSTYSDDLVMKLLFTIARITKASIEDIDRYGIASWARSMLYYEHRRWNMLIPTKDEIRTGKGEGSTKAVIEGKKFQGAMVLDPKVGTYYNVVTLDYACFDDQTEILTHRGWQTIDSIKEGEPCLSVNLESGNIENDTIEKVFKYNHDGNIINIKTPKKLDFIFTENHRMVYCRKKGGYLSGFRLELELKELQNINYYHWSIPCFGNWVGKPVQKQIKLGNSVFNTNEFFEFLGRFLGNGSISKNILSIDDNLKYKDRHEGIKNILRNMGFNPKTLGYEKQDRQGFRTYIYNKEFVNDFKILLNNKVHSLDRTIPDEFLEYNKEHLQFLFKGLMESDGSTGKNGEKSFYSANKELAEQFQLLSLKCGYNCSINCSKVKGYNDKIIDLYICTLSGFRQKKASFVVSKQHNHIQRSHYKGKLWCAATKNTTLIIRRKGRVIVTGNSLYPSIVKRYNMSYETINCNHEKCKQDNKIPQTNHYYCTKRTGLTSLIIGVIRDLRVNYFKKLSKDTSLSEHERDLYDAITQASKVILNGSYGVVGSEYFSLYCLPVAESVTALGRNILLKTKEYAETKLGLNVLAGDSVLPNTPIILKNKITNEIKIVSIESLVPKTVDQLRYSHLDKNYQIYSDNGFTNIKYVYKHKVDKKIYRILTRHSFIECTEDHSLIIDNKEVKPSSLKIGDQINLIDFKTICNNKFNKKISWLFGLFLAEGTQGIYHYPNKYKSNIKYSWRIVCLDKNMLLKAQTILKEELGFNTVIYDIRKSSHTFGLSPYNNERGGVKRLIEYFKICYDISGKKIIPSIILNSDLQTKQSFLNGFIENDGHTDNDGVTTVDQIHKNIVCGVCLLLKELGFDYTLQTRDDKSNVVRIRIIKNKNRRLLLQPNIIKKIESYDYQDDYVYDIETENHHFRAGIGNVLLHNTDSIFVHQPTQDQINSLMEFSKVNFEIDLEVDKEFQFIVFSDRKKNYFGIHKNTGKIETKGLTGKKSNIPLYIKRCFNDVAKILSSVDNDDKLEIAIQEIKKLIIIYISDLRNKKIDLNQLVFQNMLTQNTDSYGTITNKTTDLFGNKSITKKGVPIHVKIAEQMQKQSGEKIEEKTFIPFVKTKQGAMQVTEATKSQIDTEKYIDTFKTALDPILEVLGMDFDSIVYGTKKQMSLDTMFFKS